MSSTVSNLPLTFNQVLQLVVQMPLEQRKKIEKKLAKVNESEAITIPSSDKKMVLDRIKSSKPADYVEWKDFKKEMKKKYDI